MMLLDHSLKVDGGVPLDAGDQLVVVGGAAQQQLGRGRVPVDGDADSVT